MPFVWWAVTILTLPSCCALLHALLLDAQLFFFLSMYLAGNIHCPLV